MANRDQVGGTVRAIEIEFDELPPSELRGNTRAHNLARYTAGHAQEQKAIAKFRELDWEPFEQGRVVYTYYYCGAGPDPDNVPMGMKKALDAAVFVGILPGDGPKYVKSLIVRHERVPHRDEVRVTMRIEEA